MPKKGQARAVEAHWICQVIGENVRALMARSADLRRSDDLADRAKVGRRTVNRLVRGENSTLNTFGAVADALGVEPLELLVRKRQALLQVQERHSSPTVALVSPTRREKKRSVK